MVQFLSFQSRASKSTASMTSFLARGLCAVSACVCVCVCAVINYTGQNYGNNAYVYLV